VLLADVLKCPINLFPSSQFSHFYIGYRKKGVLPELPEIDVLGSFVALFFNSQRIA